MVRVMVVDDDSHIRKLIRLYLRNEGFDIVEAENGEEALACLESTPIDLVILDIMMPKKDGWDLCLEIRESWDIPILMVTAKGESQEKIKGFQLGTDDYVVKPFDPLELMMRVKALLKRYKIASEQFISIGDIDLDYRSYGMRVGKRLIHLPVKEFELLFKLASYPGQIFTRSQLIEQIWGMDYEGNERTVDVHIKRLRQRLAMYTSAIQIVTVRGLGYRLEVVHD
jgi:DNA-binding response OmpR family regulator